MTQILRSVSMQKNPAPMKYIIPTAALVVRSSIAGKKPVRDFPWKMTGGATAAKPQNAMWN
jgi:hypothetical protein